MTNRKTPRRSDTNAQSKRDGRSQPQTYVVGCKRVDEERVVAGLVRLLRRPKKEASAPTPSQTAEDAAGEGRREE
jgi:hypothetical protein